MATKRTRMAAWNLGSGLLFTALTMATGLLATPLLIQWLGTEQFGLARMMLEVFGYLTLLEMGLGGGLGSVLARALASNDRRALQGTLAAGLRVYLFTTTIILIVGLVLVLGITWIIPVRPSLVADLRWAAAVSLVGFATLFLSPFRALTEAEQRGFRVNLLLSAQMILITGLSLWLARSGGGIMGQALATTVGVVFVPLALARESLRRHPGLLRDVLRTKADPSALKALGHLSIMVLIVQIGGRLSFLTDSYIVGRVLSPEAIASLFATVRLAQLAQSQLQMVGNASWAGLAELHGRGEREAFKAKLTELTGLITFLAVTALVPIAVYSGAFVSLWMRGKGVAYGGGLLVLAASAAALLQGLFSLWGWCFLGTGQLARMAPALFLSALVNLAASIALTFRFGLAGPLLGTLFAFALINVWYFPFQLRRTFGISPVSLMLAVARPLVPGLAYGGLLWWLTRLHQPAGWIGLLLEMGATALGFLAISWIFLLTPEERGVWQKRLRGLKPGSRSGRDSASPPSSPPAPEPEPVSS